MVENLEWVTGKQITFEGVTYSVEDYVEIPDYHGGYLLELDQYYDEISVFKTKNEQPLMFQSPEFAVTNPEMMAYVQEYVQAFEDAIQSDDYAASYEGEKMHYSELFDMDSLIDYWLLNEIFFNQEFNKKSVYLYQDMDGLFQMGPMWDMDFSSGGEGNSFYTEEWAVIRFSQDAQENMWYKYLIYDPYFLVKAQERYMEIRTSYVEDIVKDGGLIDTYEVYLQQSGTENAALWPYKYNFNDWVRSFKNWMQEHLNWLDQQMATEKTLVDSLGHYREADSTLLLTNAEAAKNLHITANDGRAVRAEVYVNGKCIMDTVLHHAEAEVWLPEELFTAKAGKKNVVEVKIMDRKREILGSNYISVINE